ncbi:MAG: RluA family pseudouridine synthase [Tenericutes bacterium]|nr:RluA family pseudouridine synthase [Mycoplasmatota bacterium]
MDINILYEDNHIIVCIKPSEVLSQAGFMQKSDMVNELKNYIKEKYNKEGNVFVGLVHRLDLNVSGVMVFAKTSKAARRLSEEIRNKDFKKSYLAIVSGKFLEATGTYKDYLMKDEANRQAFVTSQSKGKLAELNYEILEYNELKDLSLVKVDLITGRFHQIRCQFSHHDHPLMGDTKYGDAKNNASFFLGLYAYQLNFKHPTKRENMLFNYKPVNKNFTDFEAINKINWRTI